MNQIIIDASGSTAGRVASFAAKQALLGKKVILVNCQDAFFSGNKRTTIDEYKRAASRGGSALKGPFFPKKNAAQFMKRVIRGMLPYKQERGRSALKRVICHSALPLEYEKEKLHSIKQHVATSALSLKELIRELS